MGVRQKNLKRIVHDHFGTRSYLRVEPKAIVASEYFNELTNVYKSWADCVIHHLCTLAHGTFVIIPVKVSHRSVAK